MKKITKESRNLAAEDKAVIMKPACSYDTAKTYLGQSPTVTSLHYSASKTQNMRSMWKIEVGKYLRLMTLAHRLYHCPLDATPNFVESYGVPFSVADSGFLRGMQSQKGTSTYYVAKDLPKDA